MSPPPSTRWPWPPWWPMMLAVALVVACSDPQMPQQIRGIWISHNPRYQQCYLEIQKDMIIFGSRGASVDRGEIRDMSYTQEKGQGVYEITYVNQSLEVFTTTLIHSEKDGERLQMKNQPDVVWHRAAAYMTAPM